MYSPAKAQAARGRASRTCRAGFRALWRTLHRSDGSRDPDRGTARRHANHHLERRARRLAGVEHISLGTVGSSADDQTGAEDAKMTTRPSPQRRCMCPTSLNPGSDASEDQVDSWLNWPCTKRLLSDKR